MKTTYERLTARYEECLLASEAAAKAGNPVAARQYRAEASRLSRKLSEIEGTVEPWE
jgi:hypothetical protein